MSNSALSACPVKSREGYLTGVSRASVASGWLLLSCTFLIAFVLIWFLVACGTKNVTYYKPGGDQYKFDRESEECLARAKMIAQSQMVSPDAKPDSGLVQKHYSDCLYAKGWSLIPLDQRDRSLWKMKERTVSFEDFSMELSSGFLLRTEGKWILGSTWSHQLNAIGPEKRTFLILVAQESIKDKIQVINYPIPAGFTLYTGGRLDKHNIRWSVFVRRYQQNVVAVLGAYIYLEKTQRISLVLSRSLTTIGWPESGIWISWLKEQTDSKELIEKPGVRKYFRFLWER
jgi:hypothetical protein